ncbi:MAG: ice-binding family protein, partial [Alkalispirochaeta sp.]
GVTNESGDALEENKVWTFTTGTEVDTTAPTVTKTDPANLEIDVDRNRTVTAFFSEAMNSATIVAANFTLVDDATSVSGAVTYDIPNEAAMFAPDSNLSADTTYTATVTTAVTDEAGNAMEADKTWTFTTTAAGDGPEPVSLGTAGNFAILAKTGISTVPDSVITGDIGVSPAAETYLTGFSQTKFTGYSTSTQVTGYLYAADMTPPTPTMMTTAISDMETAYTDAAGRVADDTAYDTTLNLGAGEIGGEILAPGLYNWGTGVTISTDVTISGAKNDVWIFQIANNLAVSNGVEVTLSGGAQARNIFWQVAGEATLGTTSHFEGILLSQTAIGLATGATTNGRLLAQSEVTLDQSTVTEPAQ